MASNRKRKAMEVHPDDNREFFSEKLSKKKGISRVVKVKKWWGEIRVDIRNHFECDGEEEPSKTGISLKVDEWNVLKGFVGEIDEAIAKNL